MAHFKLLVGLGNPGSKYSRTRHNLGFMAADYLVDRKGSGFKSGRGKWDEARVDINGQDLWVIKPLTYMNRSGQAVRSFADYFKIEPEQIIVVCDDINLPLGRLRIRDSGSAGGHNGLGDIIETLGTDAFARVRLGIDLPPGTMPSEVYVLNRFDDEELRIVEEMVKLAADAVETIHRDGIAAAQNKYN